MKSIRLFTAQRMQLPLQQLKCTASPSVMPHVKLLNHGNDILTTRSFSLNNPQCGQPSADDTGFLRKIGRKFGFLQFTSSQLRSTGFETYTNVVSSIDYARFMKGLNLPDTFYSWFLITELHVWLITARFMRENEEGRAVRNAVVEAMWQDIEMRSKQLEEVSSSARKEQVMTLVDQFQAALFSYDEGAMSSDTVLAGALWRNLFQQSRDIDFAHLEAVLEYTRAQAALLEDTTRDDLFQKRRIAWKPLVL